MLRSFPQGPCFQLAEMPAIVDKRRIEGAVAPKDFRKIGCLSIFLTGLFSTSGADCRRHVLPHHGRQ